MLVKRLLLVVISLTVGFLVTWGIVILIGTVLEQYGIWYVGFTALAIGSALGVWLDKFMGTELLPK